MKTKKLNIILLVLLLICTAIGCHSRQKPDIRPHPVNLSADSFYQQAVAILQSSYDVDSTRKCISLLDRALSIDSLNPDYYGTKAKLLAEIGELDSALHVQTLAMERKAITGEYLFQLGLFRIKVSEKVWKFCGQCSNNILTVWEHLFLKNPPMRFIREQTVFI